MLLWSLCSFFWIEIYHELMTTTGIQIILGVLYDCRNSKCHKWFHTWLFLQLHDYSILLGSARWSVRSMPHSQVGVSFTQVLWPSSFNMVSRRSSLQYDTLVSRSIIMSRSIGKTALLPTFGIVWLVKHPVVSWSHFLCHSYVQCQKTVSLQLRRKW